MIRSLLISIVAALGCVNESPVVCRSATSLLAGDSRFQKNIDGYEIEVLIDTADFSKDSMVRAVYFGREQGFPERVVVTVGLAVDGVQLYIPASVYGDLADPRDACLGYGHDRFWLTIRGGDASTSYTSVLEFDEHFVRRRRISLNEFPAQRWEETVYSFNELE